MCVVGWIQSTANPECHCSTHTNCFIHPKWCGRWRRGIQLGADSIVIHQQQNPSSSSSSSIIVATMYCPSTPVELCDESWVVFECCGLCLHKSYISCLEDYYFLNQKKQKMLIYVYELLCSFHDNKTSLLACSVVNTHHCIQMWQCSVYF